MMVQCLLSSNLFLDIPFLVVGENVLRHVVKSVIVSRKGQDKKRWKGSGG